MAHRAGLVANLLVTALEVTGRRNRNHGRELGTAVALVQTNVELLKESVGELRLHLLSPDDREPERCKIRRCAAPHVIPGESRGRNHQGDSELPAKLTHLARLEWVRVVDHTESGDGRQPKPSRKAERMEKRQDPQKTVVAVCVDGLLDALDV